MTSFGDDMGILHSTRLRQCALWTVQILSLQLWRMAYWFEILPLWHVYGARSVRYEFNRAERWAGTQHQNNWKTKKALQILLNLTLITSFQSVKLTLNQVSRKSPKRRSRIHTLFYWRLPRFWNTEFAQCARACIGEGLHVRRVSIQVRPQGNAESARPGLPDTFHLSLETSDRLPSELCYRRHLKNCSLVTTTSCLSENGTDSVQTKLTWVRSTSAGQTIVRSCYLILK